MARFNVKKVPTGIKFDLLAGNHEVIATSEVYTTRAACLNGIESVRVNSALNKIEDQTTEGYEELTNPKFVVYTDKQGEVRFNLKARNGEIIAASEGYTTKNACLNGIASVVKNAAVAEVVDV